MYNRVLIEKYHKDFIGLLDSISVTDRSGCNLDAYAGIERACRIIKEREGENLFFIGNGGSAAIASHMSIDFWKNGGIKAAAFNDSSLLTCVSNDFGYKHVFEKPLEMFANSGDVLFAISSSGKSENILKGVEVARSKGCNIITLSGFNDGNPLRTAGDLNFYAPSNKYGPVEVAHQYICHWILDILIGADKKG